MDRLCLGPSSECKLLASLAWLQVWCVLLGEACIGKLAYLFPRVEGMSNSCFVMICSTRLKTVRFSQRIGILQFVLIAKNLNKEGFSEQIRHEGILTRCAHKFNALNFTSSTSHSQDTPKSRHDPTDLFSPTLHSLQVKRNKWTSPYPM